METKFVILAAGKGTRMKQEIPKALTQVGGKPILQYLVESIEATMLGGTPIVVIGPEGTRLCEAFNKDCEYAVQKVQLGTGDAVKAAKEHTAGAEAVVVLYGDHPFISSMTLRRLIARHEERSNAITMMTVVVPSFADWHQVFEHWGRILRGKNGHIAGIREFKDASEEQKQIREVNPSLFCFDAKWLWDNIEKLRDENVQKEYYLTDLVGLAVAQGQKISSLTIAPEEAVGINTPAEREIAEKILAERK